MYQVDIEERCGTAVEECGPLTRYDRVCLIDVSRKALTKDITILDNGIGGELVQADTLGVSLWCRSYCAVAMLKNSRNMIRRDVEATKHGQIIFGLCHITRNLHSFDPSPNGEDMSSGLRLFSP